MILRRIGQGIKEQDWFIVSIEIMIVVIGIFLGMQVTDWNEDRKAEQREADYLIALLDDLRTVRSNVTSSIDSHNALTSHGLKALEYLDGETVSDDTKAIEAGILYTHRLPFPQVRLGELGVLLDHQIQVPVSDTRKRRAVIDLVDNLNNLLEIYTHIIVSIDQAHSLHLDTVSPPVARIVDGEVLTEMQASIDLEALKLDTEFKNSLQNIISRHGTSTYILSQIVVAIDRYIEGNGVPVVELLPPYNSEEGAS